MPPESAQALFTDLYAEVPSVDSETRHTVSCLTDAVSISQTR